MLPTNKKLAEIFTPTGQWISDRIVTWLILISFIFALVMFSLFDAKSIREWIGALSGWVIGTGAILFARRQAMIMENQTKIMSRQTEISKKQGLHIIDEKELMKLNQYQTETNIYWRALFDIKHEVNKLIVDFENMEKQSISDDEKMSCMRQYSQIIEKIMDLAISQEIDPSVHIQCMEISSHLSARARSNIKNAKARGSITTQISKNEFEEIISTINKTTAVLQISRNDLMRKNIALEFEQKKRFMT